MRKIKKLLAGILSAAMMLSSMTMTAFADVELTTPATIDTTKTGSITIHKYEYNGSASTENRVGTGTIADANQVPTDATGLDGVDFTLYKVMTENQLLNYYNGSDTSEVTVNTFISGTPGNYTVKNLDDNTVTGTTKTTANGGVASFTNLALGMYVVIETKAPDKVTVPADPFLVSVPMTNTDKTNWLYDINVYPKNSTSEGNVILDKVDKNGNKLAGVTFKLEKKGDTADTAWSQVGDTVTTDGTNALNFNNLTPGDYRLTEVSAPAGYIVDERPIEFTVTKDNTITCEDTRACIDLNNTSGTKVLNITLKNEKPDLTKVIVNESDETHEANAAIGSTVNYKVTVDVPENITNMKTFVLTDTPNNLKDDVNTIKVNNKTDAEDDAWTAAVYEQNGFKITFDTSKMADYAGTTLTITYRATVLATAADEGKAPNTADLTYSNKIHSDSSKEDEDADKNHIKDEAIVYNYKIEIIKYKDSIAEANKLAGVKFELYKEGSDTAISVVKTGETDGQYRLAVDGDTNTTTTLVTGTDGKLVVTGLTDGTYYLKETKTVEGYNLLKDKVKVTLNLDTVTTWTTSSDFVKNNETDAWDLVKRTYSSTTYKAGQTTASGNYVSQNIINKKGFELPTTGGMGTFLFSIVGIVLMLGGAVVLFRSRKKTA